MTSGRILTKQALLVGLLLAALFAGRRSAAQTAGEPYDKALADSLGADEYGMRSYYLAILKTGSNKNDDPVKKKAAFGGHMENIGRLSAEGKLVVAGPLEQNPSQYRGIFILAVNTREEAEALLHTDPAVREQYLAFELYKWYGSAALPKYLEYHSRIEQKKH